MAFAVTEGFTEGAFPKYKPMWKGEGFLVNSEEGIGKKFRRLCLRNPPASAFLCHRSNDTGHWRGSNDLLKIPVRNCHRGHPGVRIVSGHCPRLPCQRELAKIFDF